MLVVEAVQLMAQLVVLLMAVDLAVVEMVVKHHQQPMVELILEVEVVVVLLVMEIYIMVALVVLEL
jgi:hypothetical protein